MARCDLPETVPYIIRCPDYRIFQVYISESALGKECVDKICDILGTMETDYFSLSFTVPAGRVWINKRVSLRRQLKARKSPYLLDLRVKYYVTPDSILQTTTRELFFHQLKMDMAEGVLPVPHSKAGWLGALLAQVQMGDCQHSTTHRLIYPQYFAQWEIGIPRRIAIEHRKLRGMSREHVIKLFVADAGKLDKYGARSFPAKLAGEEEEDVDLTFFVGGKCVILEYENRPTQKIPYGILMEASYDSNKFKIKFRVFITGEPSDMSLTLRTPGSKQAHLIFRTLTEDHTYFTQATVSERVLEHYELERFSSVLRASFTNKKLEKRFHFDVVRTASESFQYHWRKLHQFASDLRIIDVVGGLGEEEDEPAAAPASPVTTANEAESFSSGHDRNGSPNPLLASRMEQPVNPPQPSFERIENTVTRERSSPLSRWRTDRLHRRNRTPPRLAEPIVTEVEDISPETEFESEDVSVLISLLPESTSSQPLVLSSSVGLVPTTDLDAVVDTSASCVVVREGEGSMEDNPVPLWMSFSPSVHHFITEVLSDTPTAAARVSQPPHQPSDSSISTAPSGDSVKTAKKNSFTGPCKVKSHHRVVDLQPAGPHNLPGCFSEMQGYRGEYSDADAIPWSDKPRDLVKEKKPKKAKRNKDSQVLVAGLTPSSLKIVKPVIERINDNFTCKICMDRFVNTAFCPCGHYITCRQCADMLLDCPVCRATIAHTMLIYQ